MVEVIWHIMEIAFPSLKTHEVSVTENHKFCLLSV